MSFSGLPLGGLVGKKGTKIHDDPYGYIPVGRSRD
jgi:hypothetical protein